MPTKCKPLPHIDRIKALLSYDAETGAFTWLISRSAKARAGTQAGHITALGYHKIGVDGVAYSAHRVVWLIMTGETPPDIIDHINGNRSDNRWSNLRAATSSENIQNCRPHADNPTSFKGVTRIPGNRYLARIMLQGKNRNLGCFNSPEAASAAYQEAAKSLFGEFANLGTDPCLNNSTSSIRGGERV